MSDRTAILSIPIWASSNNGRRIDGNAIYLGIDVYTNEYVYWYLDEVFNYHVLVLGPSGSGKSHTLGFIASQLLRLNTMRVFVFDFKNEYEDILPQYDVKNLIKINPAVTPVDIADIADVLCEEEIQQSFIRTTTFSLIEHLCKLRKVATVRHLVRLPQPWSSFLDFNGVKISELLSMNEGVFVFDLSNVSQLNELVAVIVLALITNLLKRQNKSICRTSLPNTIVLLDEAWKIIPYISTTLFEHLVRFSRSLGISLLIASQSPSDLMNVADTVFNNFSVVIALANPSRDYWGKVFRFVGLKDKLIKYAMNLEGRGEAMLRFLPSRRVRFVYLDVFRVFKKID